MYGEYSFGVTATLGDCRAATAVLLAASEYADTSVIVDQSVMKCN
jgi:hypothetical protein